MDAGGVPRRQGRGDRTHAGRRHPQDELSTTFSPFLFVPLQTYEFTDKDVSLLVMPLFHVHGLMAGVKGLLLVLGEG